MNNFLQNASAFNCGLSAFVKFDMGWVPTARFPWQQQHHTGGACLQEANTCDLNWSREWLKVSADFQLTIVDCANTSEENDFRHVSRLRNSILNSCCDLYFRLLFNCLHWLKNIRLQRNKNVLTDGAFQFQCCSGKCYVYNCLIIS